MPSEGSAEKGSVPVDVKSDVGSPFLCLLIGSPRLTKTPGRTSVSAPKKPRTLFSWCGIYVVGIYQRWIRRGTSWSCK